MSEQSKRIESVYVFENGMVMVFDQFGEQMPEYQGRKEDVLDKVKASFRGIIHQNVEWRP
jgi:hypothetical protein